MQKDCTLQGLGVVSVKLLRPPPPGHVLLLQVVAVEATLFGRLIRQLRQVTERVEHLCVVKLLLLLLLCQVFLLLQGLLSQA